MRAASLAGALAWASTCVALDVESAKRILTDRWKAVKVDSIADRRVIFQDVRIVSEQGGATSLQVNALVWDYDKGYPPNGYFGQTCVSKYQNQPFTIRSRGTTWQADGAFNPKDYPECKKNPSADVSAIPLASLPGKEAGAGETAKPTAVAKSGGIAIGAYECWAYGRARMMLNLTIQAGNRYLDSQGRAGTFALNPADGRVTFRGGMWEGALPAGTHVRYEERRGAPVLSIRGADGGEISFCEGK